MRVQKKPKAFAYRVPIGDYNYLQCVHCSPGWLSMDSACVRGQGGCWGGGVK